MLTKTDLCALRDLVWGYRRRLAHVWPTPPPLDALRFASCEAHEALDAWLRNQPGYNRNNDKALSVEAELADCAMMLVTALGEAWEPATLEKIYTGISLERICYHTAEAMSLASYESKHWVQCTEMAIAIIDAGMTGLYDEVERRLQRIESRVAGKKEMTVEDHLEASFGVNSIEELWEMTP